MVLTVPLFILRMVTTYTEHDRTVMITFGRVILVARLLEIADRKDR